MVPDVSRKKNVLPSCRKPNANDMPFNQDALDNLTAEEILALIQFTPGWLSHSF
jgi:hypothetical protein